MSVIRNATTVGCRNYCYTAAHHQRALYVFLPHQEASVPFLDARQTKKNEKSTTINN